MIEKKEKERRRGRSGSVLNVYNISSIFSRRFLVCICSSFIFYFFFFSLSFFFLETRPGSLNTPERSSFFLSTLLCMGLGAGAYCARPGLSTSPFFSFLPTFRDYPLLFIFFSFFVLSFFPPQSWESSTYTHTHKQLSPLIFLTAVERLDAVLCELFELH